MAQRMGAEHVYNLDDLKKFKESGASAEEVREASAMMAENKERREKATKELLNSDWETISPDKVKNLVQQGADGKTKNSVGQMPVHLASAYGRTEIVKYLVAHGSDVMARDDDDQTPLHSASEYGYIEVMKYLIEQGADVRAEDKWGVTPLHLASRRNHTKAVMYLVEQGADIKAKDDAGDTPLDWAKEGRCTEVVKYLEEVEKTLSQQRLQNASLSPAMRARLKERSR